MHTGSRGSPPLTQEVRNGWEIGCFTLLLKKSVSFFFSLPKPRTKRFSLDQTFLLASNNLNIIMMVDVYRDVFFSSIKFLT